MCSCDFTYSNTKVRKQILLFFLSASVFSIFIKEFLNLVFFKAFLFIDHPFNILPFALKVGNSISMMVNVTFDSLMKKVLKSQRVRKEMVFTSYQKVALKW